MADVAVEEPPGRSPSPAPRSWLGKRWRAILRAIHRDIGYLAIGFTIIYAVSGIAMNHLDDWDPSFDSSERVVKISPIADDATDEAAIEQVAAIGGLGAPDRTFRAGDEVRLEYANGSKVTAIGDTVTIQQRSDRFFFRVAVWLHATRGKQAWKYISDVYAVLLLYLAISGLFMIKGKLGLRWRGTIFVGAGIAVPVLYIVLSGGPGTEKPDPKLADQQTTGSGIRLLSPDENQ